MSGSNSERDKLPHYPWFIGDWRKDLGVQSLSYHHRGIWRELLDLMWESEQRGRLVLNGKPMSDAAIARLLGLSQQDTTNAIDVLLASGVASRDADGAIINRRMVRDQEIRGQRAEAGGKGGRSTADKYFCLSKTPSKPPAKSKQNPDNDNDNDKKQRKKQANRLSALFSRRETTPWSKKEVKAWHLILPLDDDELGMLERYYASERKRAENICRRDLLTLLNNFRGEIDRARAWCRKHPTRPVRILPTKPLVFDCAEDTEQYTPAKVAERQRMMRDLSEQLYPQPSAETHNEEASA